MSDSDDAVGWRAYGGAGDRGAIGRSELARAQEALDDLLDRLQLPPQPSAWATLLDDGSRVAVAEAHYRLGRAFIRASWINGQLRFDLAHDAMHQAVTIGDDVGSSEQRSRWWTGLGGSLKNLVVDPPDPFVHEANLEESLAANLKGLELARTLEDPQRLSAALTATGMSYQYRDAGARSDNIETATALMAEAVDLNLHHGLETPAAIAATSCGIAWVEHPDEELGMARAAEWYRQARELLDAEEFPAHARRLGRSAGWAACRQGDWPAAAEWYDLAWIAVQTAIGRAASLTDKRRELAEHGDSSSRHVYSVARAGHPNRAVALADAYAEVAASLTTTIPNRRNDPTSQHHAPPRELPVDPSAGLCYLVYSHVGSLALLAPARTTRATTTPHTPELGTSETTVEETSEPAVEVLLLDGIDSYWLKKELAWPASVPAHGPGVSSQFIDAQGRNDHLLSPDLIDRLNRDCISPVAAAAERAGWNHLYVVPRAALAEAPLSAAWSVANGLPNRDASHDVPTTMSLMPRAQLHTRHSRQARQREQHLVTIALPGDPETPLGWTELESRALEQLFPGDVTPLRHGEATVRRILDELSTATHIHFAGHGSFTPSEPMDTYFTCWDGDLSLADLATGQALEAADLFIASGCSLGSSDNICLPDEGLGLPAVLMDRFGCSLIAPIRPVYDIAAALFTIRTAELLWSDSRPTRAQAVSAAQRWLAHATGASLVAWAENRRTLDLGQGLEELGHLGDWRDQPDVWAPFSYFGW